MLRRIGKVVVVVVGIGGTVGTVWEIHHHQGETGGQEFTVPSGPAHPDHGPHGDPADPGPHERRLRFASSTTANFRVGDTRPASAPAPAQHTDSKMVAVGGVVCVFFAAWIGWTAPATGRRRRNPWVVAETPRFVVPGPAPVSFASGTRNNATLMRL
jgi:hypothetical protein